MLSPYKAAGLVNEILVANDLNEIPPQMVYNYVRKGYIEHTVVNGNKFVDELDFTSEKGFGTWMVKYLGSKGVVVESDDTNPDQLTLDDITV